MRTRLSWFCDKVIEAGWLAAVIIVPLFFNIYSQRVFEPDKLSLLRSLALVMAVAWLVRVAEDARSGRSSGETKLPLRQRVYKTPMVLPTLLLVLAYVISTLGSVDRGVSFLGSYQRMQGTYTTLSYIVIFFLVLDGLRTKRQLDRLITTVVLVSFPIAMYGLVQHFALDPLPWGGNVSIRAASNMGNAIFVGAYMVMVVPLTLSRLLENWKEAVGPFDARDGILGVLAFVVLVAALLVGMMLRRGEELAWIRWVALAIGVGLQLPIYFFSPPERRPRVLAISLPLTFAFLVAFSWILEIFFPPAQPTDIQRYFWLGLLAALVFIVAMAAFAYYLRRPLSRLILLAGYFVILIAQVVCIFYTQSRGPLLGLLAGLFVYFALLGLTRRKVWLPWLMTAVAVAVGLFFIMFNTLESPVMDTLRETPYVGRLGTVLETEEGSGKVRVLIWEGALDLIGWHEPLERPGDEGGPDRLNPVRPLIGYGPESMYVAYNRFYPPDLAHYEDRNASPDRSHNETFDALVITGVIGFAAYMFVFLSVFYYSLKWLGLIRQRWQLLTLIGLWIAGGILGALGTWAWLGPSYVGVGLPGGVMLGMAVYVFIAVVNTTVHRGAVESAWGHYSLWILALFSAVVAHYIEIHFGIAIAATRTYFWLYAAMLVVAGWRLAGQPAEAEQIPAESVVPAIEPQNALSRRRRRGARTTPQTERRSPQAEDWIGSLLVWSLLTILILSTMLFDYSTIQPKDPGPLATVWQSMTQSGGDSSPVILALILCTWGMAGLIGLSDLATRRESKGREPRDWLAGAGIYILIVLGGALVFGLLHATRLRPVTLVGSGAPNPLANTITFYYVYVCFLVVCLALALTFAFRRRTTPWRWSGEAADVAVIAMALVLPLLAGILVFVSNVSIVRADILYKQGLSAEKAQQLDGAINFYDQAIGTAREQDFYYLFSGRAYMEKAKQSTGQERTELLEGSRSQLTKAREIAPLNTDHSANLARLYRTWGGLSKGESRIERLEKALDYYVDATSLSPSNAQLYNEWGQTYLALDDQDSALEKYEESLALDQEYAQTYVLLGELYMNQDKPDKAVEAYERATKLAPRTMEAYSALGYLYSQDGDMEAALKAYERAVALRARNFNNRKNLAIIYQQMGRIDDAIREATKALELAPPKQKESMEAFLAQLGQDQPGATAEETRRIEQLLADGDSSLEAEQFQAAEDAFVRVIDLDPDNLQAHSSLAFAYARLGKIEEAIAENLAVTAMVPDDHNSHKNLALLYQQKGMLADALAEAELALATAPDDEKQPLTLYVEQLKEEQDASRPTIETGQRAGDRNPAERNDMYSSPPPMTLDLGKEYEATIKTEKGDIVVDLFADQVPNTVSNFVFLAREGYYDNTTFHRVLPDFMAQAGDPTGSGRGGPGYTFADEIDPTLRHDGPGTLSMANAGPNTNGSQFFLTYGATEWLDGKHAVFGRVVSGLEVLESLTPRDPSQNPGAPGDKILAIEIQEQ
ncbi:peptidylprolyl isomerase [Chloroflexota bacterium]